MVYVRAPPQKGTLHEYAPRLTAFEFGNTNAKNVVLFVGGLGDGLLTVPYVARLAGAIQAETNGNWTLVQALISASYSGWGTSSLSKDTKELQQLILYLKNDCKFEKVILMGHSTGCQDTLYYISNGNTPHIDGGILQAPVSDSEAFASGFSSPKLFDEMLATVKNEYIDKGKADHILPEEFRAKFFNCPINAYRYYSLASQRGDDDFFSTYLTESDFVETFGKVDTNLLVLYGEKDEFVPKTVNRQKLVDSWKDSTNPKYWSPLSKVLKGATHNVGPGSDEGAEDDLIETVLEFIDTIN
ncbi:putative fusarinine C esterase Sidjp [[Candida] railenensis]|uniref:Fusarinine C esterase Sidjp n=1 Tax=[Candida] railenensis TaxID=45579 RepID=A0A9P0VYJ9_9ASCO|nr:putative fusarinine C esterase Sidjp [[Candida] railenensis]